MKLVFPYCVTRRRLLAGAERGSRGFQGAPNRRRGRMRATEHAPCGPFHLLERIHGLAEIGERGAFVIAERRRVILSHPEREFLTLAENASRHRNTFAQPFLRFFEALERK